MMMMMIDDDDDDEKNDLHNFSTSRSKQFIEIQAKYIKKLEQKTRRTKNKHDICNIEFLTSFTTFELLNTKYLQQV